MLKPSKTNELARSYVDNLVFPIELTVQEKRQTKIEIEDMLMMIDLLESDITQLNSDELSNKMIKTKNQLARIHNVFDSQWKSIRLRKEKIYKEKKNLTQNELLNIIKEEKIRNLNVN